MTDAGRSPLRAGRRARRPTAGSRLPAASARALLGTLVVAGLLGLAGGLGLSAPAAAASSSASSSPGSGPAAGPSSAPMSGQAASLGGFQLTATGAAVRVTYEQPNFPIPATPTLELNLGYSTSSFGSGPTGESNASVLWPGSVAASFGSQLGTFVDPYLEPLFGQHVPNLTLPPWPLQAPSSYPAAPNTPTQADESSQGSTMTSATTANGGTATAAFGSGGSSTDPVLPAGFLSVGSMASSVSTGLGAAGAVASSTATLHDVSIAGGLVDLKSVTSTATSTSDGATGAVTGSTVVGQATVLGQPVTIGPKGVTAAGSAAGPNLLGSLLPPVDQLLGDLGITITVGAPMDTITPANAENPQVTAARELDGVQISIDATKLDDAVNGLVKLLPTSLQRQLVSQLPLPVPNSQVLHIDLASTKVSSAASPAFDVNQSGAGGSLSGGTGSSIGLLGSSAGGGGAGLSGASGFGGSGLSAGTGFGSSAGSTPSGPSGASASSGSPASGSLAVAAPAAVFRGVGDGLVVLGVLAALALAAILVRADRAVGTVATQDDVCPEA